MFAEMAKVKADTTKRDAIPFTQDDHDFYDSVMAATNQQTANKAFMARWAYLQNNGENPEYKSLFKNHGIYFKDVNETLPGSPGILVSKKGETPVNTHIGDLRKRLNSQGMLKDIHRHFEARTGQYDADHEGMPDLKKVWDEIDSNGDGMITGYDLAIDQKNGGKLTKKLKNVWIELGVMTKGGEISHDLNVSFRSFKSAFDKTFINDISHTNVPMNLGRKSIQGPNKEKYPFGAWQPGAHATHIKTGLEGEIDSSKLKEIKSKGKNLVDSWFLSNSTIPTTIPNGKGGFVTNTELLGIAKKVLGKKFDEVWDKVLGRISTSIEILQSSENPLEYYKKNILIPMTPGRGLSHSERVAKFRTKFDLDREVGGQDVNFDGISDIEGNNMSPKIGVGKNLSQVGMESDAKEAFLKKIHSDFLRRPFDQNVIGQIKGYTPNSILSKSQQKKHMEDYIANNKNLVLSSPEAQVFIDNYVAKLKARNARAELKRKEFDDRNFKQSPVSQPESIPQVQKSPPPPKDTNVIGPTPKKLSPQDIKRMFQRLKLRNGQDFASSDDDVSNTAGSNQDIQSYRKFGRRA